MFFDTSFVLKSYFTVPFILDCSNAEKVICNRKPLKRFRLCGSDEKTYDNECLFKKAQCKNGKLRKLYDGPCKGK